MTVPRGLSGLRAACQVGGPGADGVVSGLGEMGEQFPPLPAVPVTVPDEAGFPPGTVVDAHLDPGDGGRARPGDAPYGQVAGWQFLTLAGVCDQRPDPLEGDGFSRGPVGLVPVFV